MYLNIPEWELSCKVEYAGSSYTYGLLPYIVRNQRRYCLRYTMIHGTRYMN